MNIQKRPPQLGSGLLAALGITGLFQPRQGQTTIIPGMPAPLSMAVVGTLAAAVVLVAVLKKKKVF
jgi:hypothetical protein